MAADPLARAFCKKKIIIIINPCSEGCSKQFSWWPLFSNMAGRGVRGGEMMGDGPAVVARQGDQEDEV